MSKKNKNKNSSSHKTVQQAKDMFNVKENLKKLRSGTGKEGYETNSDIYSNKTNDKYYSTSQEDDFSSYSTTSTADRFDKINDKFSSDISGLKDAFSDHKEKISERLSEKLDKSELKYWIGGIISGIILIGSIIYALSYQEIITDTKDLKENKNEINRRIDKMEYRTDQLEKTVPKSSLPKAGAESDKKN